MTAFLARRIRTLQIALDWLIIAAAWSIAYVIRFNFFGSAQVGLLWTFLQWFFPLILISSYFLLKNGQYDRVRLLSTTNDLMRLFRINALSVVAFVVVLYFFSENRISRLTILIYAALSMVLLVVGRILVRSLIRKLRRRGFLLQRVFVVGDSSETDRYIELARYVPGTGLQIDGVFQDGRTGFAKFSGTRDQDQFRRYDLSDLDSKIKSELPDIVVLGFEDETSSFVTSFIQSHYDQLFKIQILTSEKQALLGMSTEMIDGLHIKSLNEPRFSAPELTLKRLVDFIGSLVGLVVLSPLLLLLSVLVKASSSGPIFFGQERVGMNGSSFLMWKFRTMRVGSVADSRGWTVENDPRRTSIGTFLRKTSLDELPQLWNVLVGDMSLVGPRPEQTHFVEKFRNEIPAYMLRHRMRAGITGWAQVSGWRGDTSLHKRIEYDLYYIRNWSNWFDFKILMMTFIRGFVNKNAY